MTADELKYLDYLQAAITRMAANSFQLKGWSIGLGSVIIGLTAKDAQTTLAWIALVPVLAFWYLDAYYLALERLFRDRYKVVVPALRARLQAAADAQAAAARAADPHAPNAPVINAPDAYDMGVGAPTSALIRSTFWARATALAHGPIAAMAILVFAWGLWHAHGPAGAPGVAPSPSPSPSGTAAASTKH